MFDLLDCPFSSNVEYLPCDTCQCENYELLNVNPF